MLSDIILYSVTYAKQIDWDLIVRRCREKAFVRKNVIFIVKSFERQEMVRGLCRSIHRLYPGTAIIIADDSRHPLQLNRPNVTVLHLPFNSGLGAGLAAALEQVKTPYVMRMDDDELLSIRSRVHQELLYLKKHREVGFDPNIKVIDHDEFFWRAAGVIASAAALNTVVFHRHNPYDRKYNTYRSDYENDLHYISTKKRRILQNPSFPTRQVYTG